MREEDLESALSSPAKSKILSACIGQARSARDISDHAGLPLASTYRQIKSMVANHVLVVERSAMTTDGKPYDLYRSRVRKARMEVSPAGVVITWELNMAIEDRIANTWNQLGA